MVSSARPLLVLRFDSFELNAANGELRKGGTVVKIHPQPFRVLQLLIERSNEVVTREEIQRCLWGDNTFVDFDRGINFCVSQIRSALSDDPENPRYIETIPRRGYRFIGSATATDSRGAAIPFSPAALPPEQAAPPAASGAAEPSTSHVIHVLPDPAQPISRRIPAWTKAALIAGFAAMTVAICFAIYHFRSPTKLTTRDTVVVGDFANTTGDPAFDDVLKQGLIVQLSQSPFLNIIPEQQVRDVLKLMGRSASQQLTPDVAQEVCQRAGSKAYLKGTIANLNSEYVIGLSAVNCQTGDTLAQEQVTANKKELVLKALDSGAANLRKKMGESLASVQQFDTPIEQATTPSLEALRAYSLGRSAVIKGDAAASVPRFQRAISLDPNFAMAYAWQATAYARMMEIGLGAERMKKAYALRDRTSERERFYIESHYDFMVTGNMQNVQKTYAQWALAYQHDPVPWVSTSSVDRDLGYLDRRLADVLKAMELDPEFAGAYSGAADAYLRLGRLEESRAMAERAEAKKFELFDLHFILYEISFLQNDAAGMAKQVAWAVGKPGIEERFRDAEAYSSAYHGKLQEARELWNRAAELARDNGQAEGAANYALLEATTEAEFGDYASAKRSLAPFSRNMRNVDQEMMSAIAIARARDSNRAQGMADDLLKGHPEDTILNEIALPEIRAAIEMNHARPAAAVVDLREVLPYELGSTDHMYSTYLRGLAYLQLHNGKEAAAEFKRILSHPGVVTIDPLGALAHLQLARAYAIEGEPAETRAEYESFLALWKEADPSIPILKEAKAEYAKLQ